MMRANDGVLAGAILLGLVLFGLAYNWLVAWLQKQSRHEGYTAFLVVGGVLVTLGGMESLHHIFPTGSVFIIGLLAFSASGTPMVIGSMWRHVRARELARADLMREALNDDTEGAGS